MFIFTMICLITIFFLFIIYFESDSRDATLLWPKEDNNVKPEKRIKKVKDILYLISFLKKDTHFSFDNNILDEIVEITLKLNSIYFYFKKKSKEKNGKRFKKKVKEVTSTLDEIYAFLLNVVEKDSLDEIASIESFISKKKNIKY